MDHCNAQAYWYLEWHLDVLTLWALAFTGELSEAEDLLKGLQFRSDGYSFLSSIPLVLGQDYFIIVIFCYFLYIEFQR